MKFISDGFLPPFVVLSKATERSYGIVEELFREYMQRNASLDFAGWASIEYVHWKQPSCDTTDDKSVWGHCLICGPLLTKASTCRLTRFS